MEHEPKGTLFLSPSFQLGASLNGIPSMPSNLEGLKGLEECIYVQYETDRYDYINTKYVLEMVLRCGGAIGVTRCVGQANNPV